MTASSLPYDQLQLRLKEIDTNGHHSYIELTKIPILDWYKTYTKDDLYNDIIAGITVFVLLIPQGMAVSIFITTSLFFTYYKLVCNFERFARNLRSIFVYCWTICIWRAWYFKTYFIGPNGDNIFTS